MPTIPGASDLVVQAGVLGGLAILFIIALALGLLLTRGQHKSITTILQQIISDLKEGIASRDRHIAELTGILSTLADSGQVSVEFLTKVAPPISGDTIPRSKLDAETRT